MISIYLLKETVKGYVLFLSSSRYLIQVLGLILIVVTIFVEKTLKGSSMIHVNS